MSVAHWTPSALAEREAALQGQLRRRTLARALVPAAIYMGVLTLGYAHAGFAQILVVAAAVPAAVGLYAVVASDPQREALRERAEAADRALQEGFAGGHGWLVDLLVLQGDAPTGGDRGMMWVEDGRLYFSGHRTSFGLTPDQAAGFCLQESSAPGLRHDLLLELRAGGRPLALSFSPVVRGEEGWRGWTAVNDLREAVNRWSGGGAAGGRGQLPPLEPGPGAPTAGRLLAGAGLALGYWLALAAVFVGLMASGGSLLALFVGLAGTFGGFSWGRTSSPALSLRALRDRRRLEARR